MVFLWVCFGTLELLPKCALQQSRKQAKQEKNLYWLFKLYMTEVSDYILLLVHRKPSITRKGCHSTTRVVHQHHQHHHHHQQEQGCGAGAC